MAQYFHMLSVVILPIFLTCLFGATLQYFKSVDTRNLADISLYILSPCLVLIALAQSQGQGHNMWEVAVFTGLHTVFSLAAAKLSAKIMRLTPEVNAAVSLTTVFGNSNNYGLPVLLLAYGNAGFSIGASYVIGQILLVNSLGLYIASRSEVSPRQAIKQIAKTPLIYAALAGFLIYLMHIYLPQGIVNTLHLVGNAYPAIVLLILGVQLKRVRWTGAKRKEVWLPILLRLLLVPILAKFCLVILGIKGLLASVLFVQSSMPAAVNASVLAEKYGGDQEVVTLTVAITTLISFITLPLMILWG